MRNQRALSLLIMERNIKRMDMKKEERKKKVKGKKVRKRKMRKVLKVKKRSIS